MQFLGEQGSAIFALLRKESMQTTQNLYDLSLKPSYFIPTCFKCQFLVKLQKAKKSAGFAQLRMDNLPPEIMGNLRANAGF